jgi:hypothetical protein
MHEDRAERLRQILADLGPGARADLLRVLTAPSRVRADVIRQLHERKDKRSLMELLIDLEEDGFARAMIVQALRGFRDR